jgi:PDZ domain-containing protein
MEHRRQDAVRQSLTDMLHIEREIAEGLGRRLDHPGADSETTRAMQRFRAVVNTHVDALAQHVEKYGGQIASRRAPSSWTDAPHQFDANRPLSRVLLECHVAFTHAAAAYSALFETALRLYVPPLRTLSTQHLKAHVINAHMTNALAARAVARELEENGLHCSCVCPMCGMGACACVVTGAGALAMAWHEASAQAGVGEGFLLQRPRPHSELAAADVQAGDRITAVDGLPVRSVPEIQAAIRKHQLGDAVTLQLVRGGEVRELVVKHVSDNPPS